MQIGDTAGCKPALRNGFTLLDVLCCDRNSAFNDLYRMCLTVQNAARLAYPITQAGSVAGVTEARARYLLDEFPPKGGNSAPPTPPAPTPTPTPSAA